MATINKEISKDGGSIEVNYRFNNNDCSTTKVGAKSDSLWLTVETNQTGNKFIISAPSNNNSERYGYITPTYNGSDCTNKKIKVTQPGGGVTPSGFSAKLTINNLDNGDIATINWGDNSDPTVIDDNGAVYHTYQSDELFTATITADGYNRETVLFASNDTEKSVTMQKSAPGGFNATLTLSGLDSAIATINWGDGIVEYNVGNGSTTHNYQSDGSFSVTVTASGYITKTTSFIKDSAESQTIIMQKSAPTGCNCESAEIGDMQANTNIESSTQSRVTIATFTSSTECSSSDFTFARVNGDNIAINIIPLNDGEGNYIIKASILDNTDDDPRSETFGIYINDRWCNGFEITQNGASAPTGFYATLIISGLEGNDRATVDWNDGNAENVGNGSIGHSYQTDGPFSVTITAEGYVNKTTSFVKDSAESQSIEMRKSSPAPTSFYVTLRILGLDDVTATVDWGDGDIETGIGNGYTDHTYEIEGNTFNVVITANGYVAKTTSFVRDSILIREVEMEKYAPTPTGFMATLTISGLEGNDRATVDWGDYNHETVGNGSTTHNYQSDGSFSVTVTASGYITKTTSFIKDSAESQSITMEKSTPPVECSCNAIQMPDVDFDSNDTSSIRKDCEIYNAPEGCIINVTASDTEHFAVTANTTTGITVSPNSYNPYEEPYADIITVVLTFSDSSTCTKTLTAIQYGITPSAGFYGTLTINGLENNDTVTIHWGDGTSNSSVGNGIITHPYQIEEATITVMSPKYEIYSTNLSRGGSEAETIPMELLSIGFTASLTINGLEGDDKASIDWGDNKSDSNVGNTTKFHTYKLLDDADVIVTADGYTTQTINLSKNGVIDYTMTMVKVTPPSECDCNEISIPDVGFEWNDTEPSTVEVHDTTDCIESVGTYDDTLNFLITATTTSVSVQPREPNSSTEPIEDTVSITFTLSDGSTCTVEFTARQNGKTGDGCSNLTLQLNGCSNLTLQLN